MEFLNFKPGLVGGHCIGVDPYYLDYKAKKLDIILELFHQVVKLMIVLVHLLQKNN